MKKQTKKKTTERIHPLAIHKHIARHFHKRAHKVTHVGFHSHHFLAHCGELLFVLLLGLGGIMSANFTWSLEGLERSNMTEVGTYLLQAINNPQNILTQGNLISIRQMDSNVDNTFTKWYCTYGAARISPEFFPYSADGLTQQRTRWGNAVNWCENAAATWYKIGNTPVQWALIVYDAGGRFGPYGHVGKVMHYNRSLNKIIVRDMAWVAKFTMSDRREDLATANVKCYIYNSRTNTSGTTTWSMTNTWTDTNTGSNTNTWSTTTDDDNGWSTTTDDGGSWWTTTNGGWTTTPTGATPPPTPPEEPVTPPTENGTTNVALDFSKAWALAQHLITQRTIKANLLGNTTMHVGDESVLTFNITDKNTGEKISQVLPLSFELVTSKKNISLDYASLKLIKDGKITVYIKALEKGTTSLTINFWEDKVGKIGFTVK